MAEVTPGDILRAVEGEIREALTARIREADGYAHRRNTVDLHNPTTRMVISRRDLQVTIEITASWKDEETT